MNILVQGVGDIGSAVAHALFLAGHAVVIHSTPNPTMSRRLMAFVDAIWDGQATLEGLVGARVDRLDDLPAILDQRQVIPIVLMDLGLVIQAVQPDVLIDAQMRKRVMPVRQHGWAPLTIGLGPNFIAGETVDVAVETSWTDLGRVITEGQTLPLDGDPRPINGHARDRFIYAPVAGVFRSERMIGEAVEQGDTVAWIDGTPLAAPLTGRLRGLTRPGVPVVVGTKVIEVDPRGDGAIISGLGGRPRRIAEGVLDAVTMWLANRQY